MCSISSIGSAAVYSPVQAPAPISAKTAAVNSVNVGPAATVELSCTARK